MRNWPQRVLELDQTEVRGVEFPEIVGRSLPYAEVRAELRRALKVPYPVLLTGETGTGKELAASLLHRYGPRSGESLITLNCAALPENLLESELFGYRKGAFTSAFQDSPGLFAAAHRGTLFLDEVHHLSLAAQAKLLRAVDSGEYLPVGARQPAHSDARLVAATNQDLEALVRAGAFRRDLFYRLNVLTIRMPALREVPDDIPALVEHCLRLIGECVRIVPPAPSSAAMAALVAAPWPGNVRQLRHELERATLRCSSGELRVEHLSSQVHSLAPSPGRFLEMKDRVGEAWERDQIRRGLERTGWNVSRLARELSLSRRGLTAKIARYGLRRAQAS